MCVTSAPPYNVSLHDVMMLVPHIIREYDVRCEILPGSYYNQEKDLMENSVCVKRLHEDLLQEKSICGGEDTE